MRSILAAVSIALLMVLLAMQATPSSAQKREEQKQTEAEQQAAQRAKDRKATDSQYKSAIERLPDKKFDPGATCADGAARCAAAALFLGGRRETDLARAAGGGDTLLLLVPVGLWLLLFLVAACLTFGHDVPPCATAALTFELSMEYGDLSEHAPLPTRGRRARRQPRS